MVKPIDITKTVIVPKPQPRYNKLKSFFIGRAPMDVTDEGGVEVKANPTEKIKQPHLDNSVIKDTEWSDLY
jgi:hypothetical protein|tara:strand:+ start:153 stop:365 length:213 start_codon:yes stop_codon:yes gene_type:complete